MFPIEKFTDFQIAFAGNALPYMPKYLDIRDTPEAKKYVKIAQTLFHSGGRLVTAPRAGVDKQSAVRHISYVLHSFEPSHEHKMAAVSWLLDEWFESVKVE